LIVKNRPFAAAKVSTLAGSSKTHTCLSVCKKRLIRRPALVVCEGLFTLGNIRLLFQFLILRATDKSIREYKIFCWPMFMCQNNHRLNMALGGISLIQKFAMAA
jgi:hypothetical protein